ncbi:unnamed protein product [Rotaria sordida]|uniref:Uncharacterized protein n=1 Tax=Rotaria sordida TaxID=392033 RepID=A0A818FDK0_9BILA|nr:unnamed protein product [Rotaria sordida]CAF0765204.1 unnamed protein product [Rotaria sordida]CAF0771252.1 unnamed protein product [Rotaria sordida]CAF1279340.1 unnamed protein product [Rotaria sordida]CAF1530544.1 unnamed protein product [Rotaria sordida]
MTKFRRRHRVGKSENDRVYLVENNNDNSNNRHEYSKIRRIAWKLAKGTWRALKIGFQTAITTQSFCIVVEPNTVATTIVEYQMRNTERQ